MIRVPVFSPISPNRPFTGKFSFGHVNAIEVQSKNQDGSNRSLADMKAELFYKRDQILRNNLKEGSNG